MKNQNNQKFTTEEQIIICNGKKAWNSYLDCMKGAEQLFQFKEDFENFYFDTEAGGISYARVSEGNKRSGKKIKAALEKEGVDIDAMTKIFEYEIEEANLAQN